MVTRSLQQGPTPSNKAAPPKNAIPYAIVGADYTKYIQTTTLLSAQIPLINPPPIKPVAPVLKFKGRTLKQKVGNEKEKEGEHVGKGN